MMPQVRICTACATPLNFLGNSGESQIFKCPSCGLGATVNKFAVGTVNKFAIGMVNGKTEKYAIYHRDEVYIKEEDQFKNIFQKRLDLISKFKKTGRALEVGSSTGLFLSLLKNKGWDVQGVEVSRTAVEAAEKRGIPIITSTFEKAKLNRGYDLVIFNHVLEHLEDPIATLKKANYVLKNGGLVLIDLPNFGSFWARIQGAKWRYVLPNEHLWHFTSKSLDILLQKNGFNVIYLATHSGIWGYGSPLEEIWDALIGRKKRFFSDLFSALPALLLSRLNLGSGLTVIARRKKNES